MDYSFLGDLNQQKFDAAPDDTVFGVFVDEDFVDNGLKYRRTIHKWLTKKEIVEQMKN